VGRENDQSGTDPQESVTVRTGGATEPGGRDTEPDAGRSKSEIAVDAYLMALTVEDVAALQRVRKIVREEVPDATESLRFRIPTFIYKGPLVGYSSGKTGCCFFVMSRDVMEAFADELEPFFFGPGTLGFSGTRPLPTQLIRKIVRVRVAENDAKQRAEGAVDES
jgi:uncharacterized protein YdhG (YjbR/CyaY superfamily)